MYCGKLFRTTAEYSPVKSKVQGALSLGLAFFFSPPHPPSIFDDQDGSIYPANINSKCKQNEAGTGGYKWKIN